MSPKRTYSLIIETENLGMAGIQDLENSLNSLKLQIKSEDCVKETILVVGNRLAPDIQKEILSKFPWVKIHIDTNITDYAESKMVGAKVAKGDVLIFADSDMKYSQNWLKNMIKTFEEYPNKYIIAGDTRLSCDSAYEMALNTIWMVQISDGNITKPVPYKHFPLNNFAIERQIILNNPIPFKLPLYRNKIVAWQTILEGRGYKTLRAPGTRGFHAPPEKFMDWLYRMLIYGNDFVSAADFRVDSQMKIVELNNLKGRLFKVLLLPLWKTQQMFLNTYKLLREDTSRFKYLLQSLVIASVCILVISIGGIFAIFNRMYLYDKITSYESDNS